MIASETVTLPPQVFLSRDGSPPAPEKMEPVTAWSWKPSGGLWTSSLRDDGTTSWDDWIEGERIDWYASAVRYVLDPSPARVFVIDGRDALVALFAAYGADEREMSPALRNLREAYHREPWQDDGLDWTAFAADHDALHLTEAACWSLRLDSMFVYGWDAESTIWFRWRFDGVRPA